MDILMVSAELAPFAGSSDTGLRVAGLSKALRQLGHEVTVALPRYRSFDRSELLLARRLNPLVLPAGLELALQDGQLASGVQLVLFDAPAFVVEPASLADGAPEDGERFALLGLGAAALGAQRREQGRPFDLVHLHDWPAALTPLFLRALGEASLPTVLTIHEAEPRGRFPLAALGAPAGVLPESVRELAAASGGLDFLEAGVRAARRVTAVSSGQAEHLLDQERSGALAEALRLHDQELPAIVEGIDYSIFNPATDAALKSRYDAEDAGNKALNKTDLLRDLELELGLDTPLVVILGTPRREQDAAYVWRSLGRLLKNDLRLVVTGMSDRERAHIESVKREHAAVFGWLRSEDTASVRRACAAADLAIVIGRGPPCGSPELVAQRYGAVPVAPARDAFLDTIVDCDAALETGTGFLYSDETELGLVGAVQRALAAQRSPAWPRLVRRVLRLDVGWDRPARRYVQVYRQALGTAPVA